MEIKHKRIVLRDEIEADIADEIRWNTTETHWHDFDAPWDKDEDLRSFDAEKCRADTLARMASPRPESEMRKSFEICLADGRHIGSTGSYYIDGDCNIEKERKFSPPRHTIGIDICEPDCWGRGLAARCTRRYAPTTSVRATASCTRRPGRETSGCCAWRRG